MTRPSPAPDKLALAFQALKAGRATDAERLCRALLAERREDARVPALLARTLVALGRDADARTQIDRALELDPASVPALMEHAALSKREGANEAHADALRRLASLQPPNAGLYHDLGVAELELGQLDAARDALGLALRLAPNLVDATFKLANISYVAREFEDALAGYQRCVAVRPQWLEAWLNLGETLVQLERKREALDAFRRAAAIDDDSFKAHEGAARCMWDLKIDMREWLPERRRMTELDPTPASYVRLGMDYWKASCFVEAREAYAHAVSLDPDYLPARWGVLQVPRSVVYPDDAAVAVFEREWLDGIAHFSALELGPEHANQCLSCVTLATNFYLHYLGKPYVAEQREYARIVERMIAVAVPQALEPLSNTRPRDGRIRVGFCSGYIRRHTVTKLFGRLITMLDRSRFEISVFHTANVQNDVTEQIRAQADHFALGERDVADWVSEVRARELDVLVFLDIGMHPLVQALAAVRLAPVQCALWGHPVTPGFSAIDHFLTADAMEAPGGEQFYAEKVVRLPNLGCWYERPRTLPQAVPEIAAGDERIEVFFAQAAYKIMPFHDDVLARIAQAAPAVRFHMTPHPQSPVREALRSRIGRAFAARGLQLDRHLGVFRFVSEAEFFGIASAAHFNLDSIGWSGGNTTLEILWHDVPTLTLPGELMRSRHTYAMLKLMELDELIASDVDDYVARAVRLATDADWREELRAKIRERKHRLYEDQSVLDAFSQYLESACRSAL